jgi:hypothetical protein
VIPVDAPLVAFLAVFVALVFLPALALVVGIVIIDIRVRRALVAHHKDERQRVDDLVRKLLVAAGRRPMGASDDRAAPTCTSLHRARTPRAW